MTRRTQAAGLLALLCGALAGCGGSPAESGWAGTYDATFVGIGKFTSPPGAPDASYADTGVITVTDQPDGQIQMAWQVGTNLPSGTIVFTVAGTSASGTGNGTGGTCWTGKLTNGATQTTCCETCAATLAGRSLSQSQKGRINGVTTQGVPYTGTYDGTWTGTRR